MDALPLPGTRNCPTRRPMRPHPGLPWLLALPFGLACFLPRTLTSAQPGVSFESGDLVVRTKGSLLLYRGGEQIASWGESWVIGTDAQPSVYAASADGEALVLRRYTSTADHTEFRSEALGAGLTVSKVLHWRGKAHIVYTIDHEENAAGPWEEGDEGRVSGRWVCVIPFDPAAGEFLRPIPLRDEFERAEIIMRPKELTDGSPIPVGARDAVLEGGLFDAAITPRGELWLSTQGKLTSYMLGGLPEGLLKLLDPDNIEGFGQRVGKIDWWISRHGNGTGVAALSDTRLIVVNGNAPGGLTIVNTVDPPASRPLCQAVFPEDKPAWGLRPVLDLGDEILVAHSHPDVDKIFRVSRATGEVLGTVVEGIGIRDMALIGE